MIIVWYDVLSKLVTFIPARVSDNPALLQVDPEYLAWLQSLPLLERERLLGGNWKIRPAAGLYFKREWCAVVDAVPTDLDVVHYWDRSVPKHNPLKPIGLLAPWSGKHCRKNRKTRANPPRLPRRLAALSGNCLPAGSPLTAVRTDRETEDVGTVVARNP